MSQDRGARDERRAPGDTRPVDRVARGEVVGTVEHYIGLGDEFVELRFVDARRQRHALDLRVDLAQGRQRRVDLGLAHRAGAVNDLALQVAELDGVVIAQHQASDAARRQVHRGRRSQSAETDDQRVAGEQAFLALDPDVFQQNMAAVAKELLVVHAAYSVSAKKGAVRARRIR